MKLNEFNPVLITADNGYAANIMSKMIEIAEKHNHIFAYTFIQLWKEIPILTSDKAIKICQKHETLHLSRFL